MSWIPGGVIIKRSFQKDAVHDNRLRHDIAVDIVGVIRRVIFRIGQRRETANTIVGIGRGPAFRVRLGNFAAQTVIFIACGIAKSVACRDLTAKNIISVRRKSRKRIRAALRRFHAPTVLVVLLNRRDRKAVHGIMDITVIRGVIDDTDRPGFPTNFEVMYPSRLASSVIVSVFHQWIIWYQCCSAPIFPRNLGLISAFLGLVKPLELPVFPSYQIAFRL